MTKRYVLFSRGQIFGETDDVAEAITMRQTGQVLGDRMENKLYDLMLKAFVSHLKIQIP